MTKVLVIGDGRMGAIVRELVEADEALELAGVVNSANADELVSETPAADVAIDFSHKSMFSQVEAYVQRTHTPLVSGTTGYTDEEFARLQALGQVAPIIHSTNYSLGVAVLRHMVAQATRELEGFDVEIVETHHNQKADAPSGTAKTLLQTVQEQRELHPVYGREGMCGARDAGEIAVLAVRGGTVAGTHEVHFFGDNEELEITHRAQSRRIFATGSVAAAKKLIGKPNAFYTFDELMF